MARKLKGKNSKKISKKQKKTLEKMDKVRKEDNEVLRDRIKKTLEWLYLQKTKADSNIKKLNKELEQSRIQLERIAGAIAMIKGIIEGDEPYGRQEHQDKK